MLRFVFSAEDMARTRFAISPLWETVMAVRTLAGADPDGVHRRWTAEVRPRLAAARLDLAPLHALLPLTSTVVPGFLCPTPSTSAPTLDLELAAVRATAPERILTRQPEARATIAALRADPVAGLDGLCRLIEEFWELALAPYWPRVQTLLEADVQYRARRFAEGGAHALFADLHPDVSWHEGVLTVDHRVLSGAREPGGRGLLLVPSAFAHPRLFSTLDGAERQILRYPPRGIGTLWEAAPTAAPEALAALVGRTRARLLAELTAPVSTTDLARRTGVTPGGVSQHLGVLRAAGLVSSHRAGREVRYARTRAAESLLRAASSAPAAR
ncbi:DUF5937 family protein [Streptomyces sp. BI20]|uniref:ArsR/SmtB family transcription factor n=1 Tax=Streptomyces sp. BI20 TaxID=3403460 RepID=UPI003C7950C8